MVTNSLPTVAIILPTLNEEKFITLCLESILKQTYPIELMDVVFVDGGSSDDTKSIIEKYSARYANIRLLDNPKRIQAAAFNIGVENTSAPIVIRMDAHVSYDPEYVMRCVKHLINNERFGNVGGKCDILAQRNTTVAMANALLNKMKFGIGGADFRTGTVAGEVDTVPFGAFRRDVLQIVGPMNEHLPRGEDNEYNARIRKAGYRIYFDPDIKCCYYARPTFIASIRQMYANGASIGDLLINYRSAVGLRHMIPLFFVLTIFVLIIAAIYIPIARYLLITELVLYFSLNIASSIIAGYRAGWKVLMVLPVLILAVHCAYGIGTLAGFVKAIVNKLI